MAEAMQIPRAVAVMRQVPYQSNLAQRFPTQGGSLAKK